MISNSGRGRNMNKLVDRINSELFNIYEHFKANISLVSVNNNNIIIIFYLIINKLHNTQQINT